MNTPAPSPQPPAEGTPPACAPPPPTLSPPPPPPLRPQRPITREALRGEGFSDAYAPLPGPLTLTRILDSLLKLPGQITHEIIEGRRGSAIVLLSGLTAACLLLYGAVMGSFAGGNQLWIVPLKVVAGALLSAAICLPSLFILASLSGGRQSLSQTIGLLLQSLALAAVLLVGFAPIAWIFSQATGTTVFMGLLHLMIWGIALGFSQALLQRAFSFLNRQSMHIIRFWSAIFFVVLLQMSTTLRPLIGSEKGLWTSGKKFFLAHWGDCLGNPSP